MGTELTLSATGADGTHLTRELIGWLRREPELRGTVTPLDVVPTLGEMGSLVGLATVAVGSGGVLSVLATSLRAWFAQPRRSDVRIEIRSPDGKSVIVDAERVRDVSAILQSVVDLTGDPKADVGGRDASTGSGYLTSDPHRDRPV
ncbi:effector-associated constant component EACC1 [Nocardia coffeae]|uniref:effector-associated constant component EACC1 n=1 Tax=Nocardia coffeae TaxID=2873381 RepID=UPI003558819E